MMQIRMPLDFFLSYLYAVNSVSGFLHAWGTDAASPRQPGPDPGPRQGLCLRIPWRCHILGQRVTGRGHREVLLKGESLQSPAGKNSFPPPHLLHSLTPHLIFFFTLQLFLPSLKIAHMCHGGGGKTEMAVVFTRLLVDVDDVTGLQVQ